MGSDAVVTVSGRVRPADTVFENHIDSGNLPNARLFEFQ